MTRAMPEKDGTIRRAARRADENARAALFLAQLEAATGDDWFRDAARPARGRPSPKTGRKDEQGYRGGLSILYRPGGSATAKSCRARR